MVPLKLIINGFLSYREKVEIDFSGFDLACISGVNGAGKSSLLDAITWVLFGKARNDDEALINLHPSVKTAEVTFYFEYEGNIYRVYRSTSRNKKSVLEFHILINPESYWNGAEQPLEWKPLTERVKTETQDRIKKVLKLDYVTFVNSAFFLQGKADQFAQQTATERKRILSNILGLDIWEEYRKRAAERLKNADNDLENIKYRLQEIEQELQEEPARIAQLQKIKEDLSLLEKTRSAKESQLQAAHQLRQMLDEKRKRLQELQNQKEQSEASLREWQKRLAEAQEEQQTYQQILHRAPEIQAAKAEWEKIRLELEAWDQNAARNYEYEQIRSPLLAQLAAEKARLEQELHHFQQQQAAITQLAATLPDLQQQITTIEQKIQYLHTQLEQREAIEQQIRNTHDLQAELRAENLRLKAEMEELRNRIDQIRQEDDAPCPFCGKPLPKAEREQLVAELTTQGKQRGDRYRANKERIEQLDQQEQELKAKLKSLEEHERTIAAASQQLLSLQRDFEKTKNEIGQWEQQELPKMAWVIKQLEEDSFLPQVQKQLQEVEEKLKELGYDVAAHDALRRKELEKRACLEEVQLLEKAHIVLEQLEKQCADLQINILQRSTELEQLQQELIALNTSLSAEEAQAPDYDQIEEEVFQLKEKENQLRMDLGSAQQRVAVLEERRVQQAMYSEERNEIIRRITCYKQLEQAFGKDGIPAILIEQALPVIEEKANEILNRLSEGTMFVRFITQAPYKDRSRADELRETLDIQITDSLGTRDYEMFSGGETFRVNFAIRLALSELLTQRAGARLQTLVIDEGFGSQDSLGRQRLIEAIHTIREDFAKILVITHMDEIKETFPIRLEVEKTPNGSRVTIL